ncbi:intradiol ring-cleavage dioxygenase [Actinokineospora bangkokensis]|uniref:Intradiol ring-cleavage dioxygenases domain-containing protein n=1 Tax=Actinokineospora bangkokensis TaxID=1193682 RepID=A0A1Q9LCK2_9PSEU|nr:intradiol ring-cleavage dioxygenase [Actinokineospora bangkokensis]OLR89743.1 hypothetical protein BJP25_01560 [Actinokineospora bangkokensis]
MHPDQDIPDTQASDHDRGLAFDLATLGRRRVLALLGGAGLAAVAACAPAATGSSGATTTTSGSAVAAGLTEIPDETAGPYPGDGSNGPNALTESGIVRSDIRSSFGSSTTTAQGVPLTIDLTVMDAGAGTPLAGSAVYLWHCDRDGNYSLYARGLTGENYLRGVQEAGTAGRVSFTSIFPAAYSGRWPHVHFEVYRSLADATSAGDPVKTSQLALPEEACKQVYATDGYSRSTGNLSRTSLARDMVFSDGWTSQLAAVSGDTAGGYTATLVVAV